MTYRLTTRAVALAAVLGAGCALAQTKPPVTDVGPPPAEDRDSAGAIVMESAPVRAQRAAGVDPAAATRTMGNVGRGVESSTMKHRMREELKRDREDAARELRERGAGSLTQ